MLKSGPRLPFQKTTHVTVKTQTKHTSHMLPTSPEGSILHFSHCALKELEVQMMCHLSDFEDFSSRRPWASSQGLTMVGREDCHPTGTITIKQEQQQPEQLPTVPFQK